MIELGLLSSLVLVLSLVLGSVLNTVITRLPVMVENRMRYEVNDLLHLHSMARPIFNLFLPRSHCQSCKLSIRLRDLIPIVSWLLLGGRCSHCQAQIPLRYPIIEISTLLYVCAGVLVFGLSITTLFVVIALALLLCLATIDIEQGQLPDELTYSLLWMGLLASIVCARWSVLPEIQSSVIGAVVGYSAFWTIKKIFYLVTRREGMGLGDCKLLAAIGAWVGWELLFIAVILATALSIPYGIFLILRRTYSRTEGLPFGPALAFGGGITLLYGREISALITIY